MGSRPAPAARGPIFEKQMWPAARAVAWRPGPHTYKSYYALYNFGSIRVKLFCQFIS